MYSKKFFGSKWRRFAIVLCFLAVLCTCAVRAEEKSIGSTAPNQEEKGAVLPDVDTYFQKSYAANSDIVGWLTAGKRIDYPVVQRDNAYYLSHGFHGGSDYNGTLFVNEANAIWPRDDILLIHGHNIKSGKMFGELTRYERFSYASKYPIIMFRTIYDKEDVYYAPIAAFNASMDEGNSSYFNILQFNFDNDPEGFPAVSSGARQSAAYQAYIDSILSLSIWKSPVDITTDDQLLMLVTCSYHQANGRFVLVCRKLRDDENVEHMKELFLEASQK